ncbi:MAG: SlyX protein [Micavibrio sp.]|nr:SlyX protein [Micavibrio sp.]|tara:strand:- start:1503 stop:1748 length:246 start_codon:yes stop_codon:yes gene_type:complete
MTEKIEKRIEVLESKISYQEHLIEELSELTTAQWKEIEILKRRLQKTHEEIENYIEEARESAGEKSLTPTEQAARDKPPHY